MPDSSENGATPAGPIERVEKLARRVRQITRRDIWMMTGVEHSGVRNGIYRTLRIVLLSWEGIRHNRLTSQAAALSYYTLIGLGPLLAVGIMISGFLIKGNSEEVVVKALTDLLYFVAPPAAEAADMGETGQAGAGAAFDPEIVAALHQVVSTAQQGTLGLLGAAVLLFISIQLLGHIEETYNHIWGVRHSRGIFQRFAFYWTGISFFAVLGTAALTFGTVAKLANYLPVDEKLGATVLTALSPVITFVAIMVLMTFFIRYIPNTRVRWGTALAGALMVTVLLYLNQAFSFFYVGFAIRQQNLFGFVGLIPILLFGLWLFWVILLLGGQFAYALQNAESLSHQREWENASFHTRELIAVSLLSHICNRFLKCEKAHSAHSLSNAARLPIDVVNQTLQALEEIGLIVQIHSSDENGLPLARYHPARPVESLSVGTFKQAYETYGNNRGADLITGSDPVAEYYSEQILTHNEQILNEQPIATLLNSTTTNNTDLHK